MVMILGRGLHFSAFHLVQVLRNCVVKVCSVLNHIRVHSVFCRKMSDIESCEWSEDETSSSSVSFSVNGIALDISVSNTTGAESHLESCVWSDDGVESSATIADYPPLGCTSKPSYSSRRKLHYSKRTPQKEMTLNIPRSPMEKQRTSSIVPRCQPGVSPSQWTLRSYANEWLLIRRKLCYKHDLFEYDVLFAHTEFISKKASEQR